MAAVKNAYNSCTHDVCAEWFDFESSGCNIVKDKLDEIVLEYFKDADSDTVKFVSSKVYTMLIIVLYVRYLIHTHTSCVLLYMSL